MAKAQRKADAAAVDPQIAKEFLCALVSGNAHNVSTDAEKNHELVDKAFALAEAFAAYQ